MFDKKNWQKILAITLFIVLLGAYYDRLSFETRTMVLPLMIFIAAGFVIGRLKQFEHEIHSSKVITQEIMAQTFSILDSNGKERVSISAASDDVSMIFYDENRMARASLELLHRKPILKLAEDRGSAMIAFDEDGIPNITLRNDADEIIWTAP